MDSDNLTDQENNIILILRQIGLTDITLELIEIGLVQLSEGEDKVNEIFKEALRDFSCARRSSQP